ncbi:GABR2-like protein [Mya arenaria]|uniref:GABR2-like protein n=1 Tax=Mya arenaria TaxID=6604 RepID=A0ABY7F9B8_MYAAR|nr:GABR2-like protein [Mya arenaria]
MEEIEELATATGHTSNYVAAAMDQFHLIKPVTELDFLILNKNSANDVRVDVASFDPKNTHKAPSDMFTYQDRPVPASLVSFVAVIVMNTFGAAMSFAFLFFNIYYRNNSINMKHFRDTYIFYGKQMHLNKIIEKDNYSLQRNVIKDAHLFGLIGAFMSIDLVILIPWTIIHPMRKVEIVARSEYSTDNDVIWSVIYSYCHNQFEVYWIAVVYVYKGLLLAFGVFLAWETRQVTVPELNDSKYIGACIYNVVVMCVFGVPLSHVMPEEETTLLYVLGSCLIIFGTTVCQCIIFIPKTLRKPQHSKRLDIVSDVKLGVDLPAAPNATDTDNVKEENKLLRMRLASMTGNIHFYKSGTDYVLFKTDGASTSTEREQKKSND